MVSRRTVQIGALGCLLDLINIAGHAEDVSIQTLSIVPSLPPSLRDYTGRPDLNVKEYAELVFNVLNQRQAQGIESPTPEQTIVAKAIIKFVQDRLCITPYDVANLLLDVAESRLLSTPFIWSSYMRAWPVKANPLIMEFFSSTRTVPRGDTTAWCSAFVNWCSSVTQKSSARTGDARALSYANPSEPGWVKCVTFEDGLPKVTIQPREGDIIVFEDRGSPGSGHVAFFVSMDTRSVVLLGGNQISSNTHSISRQRWLLKSSKSTALVIMTHPTLHRSI